LNASEDITYPLGVTCDKEGVNQNYDNVGGHDPDSRGSPWSHAIALMADARDFGICDGLVPCCERRHEGRDDQVACSLNGHIEIPLKRIHKERLCRNYKSNAAQKLILADHQ
jgi:hypothetical protein